MNYISTKELANKWKISVSRIVRLAKEGRIPDAKLVGKSWMFPADSPKPADKRTKQTTAAAERKPFRFPLYLYTPYTESAIANDFTDEERALYHAEQVFYCGDYLKCFHLLTDLLTSAKDPYVRFGANYYLCNCEIFLEHYPQACRLFYELNIQLTKDTHHQKELEFPVHDLESYFSGNQYYLDTFHIDPSHAYPHEMHDYILLESAFSDALRSSILRVPVNTAPYQLICCGNSSQISMLTKTMMHIYCFIICLAQGEQQQGIYHLYESCCLAEENNLEHSIAFVLHYTPNQFIDALQSKNPDLLHRLQHISEVHNKTFHKLLEYTGKNNIFMNISGSDYQYISFAIEGYTNKEIASMLHLSTATVSKKYAILYEKLGIHSKSDLIKACMEQFKDY